MMPWWYLVVGCFLAGDILRTGESAGCEECVVSYIEEFHVIKNLIRMLSEVKDTGWK